MKLPVAQALLCLLSLGLFLPLSAQDQTPNTLPTSVLVAQTPSVTSPPSAVEPPVSMPSNGNTLDIDAGSFYYSDGVSYFTGNVTLKVNKVTIKSNELNYTDKTRLAVATGNVSIVTEDGNIYYGEALEYNVTAGKWRFLDVSVQYPPGILGQRFISPIFVNAEEITNINHGVAANSAIVTTCNLANPHYYVRSRHVEIYPGDKLIARDNDFYVLGHRIIHVPYFFLSLKQRRSPIVPEFGRNEEEGYYARGLYQYFFSPDQLGGVRLDETEKLGMGLGVDHFYSFGSGNGEAFGYTREGFKEFVLRLDHKQQLPADIEMSFHGDVRQNSRFTLQPTTYTIMNVDLSRNVNSSSSRLLFTRNLTEGPFSTDNIISNFTFTPRLNRAKFNTSFRYSSFSSTGVGVTSPPEQFLWSNIKWMYPLGFTSFNVQVDKRSVIETASTLTNRFPGVQRLPEIYLTSSRTDKNLGFLTPVTQAFTVGWGIFNEREGGVTLNRYRLNWDSPAAQWNLGRTTLGLSSHLKQTVYGDKDTTAQYIADASFNATTKFGGWQNYMRYARKEVRGFAAFSFDVDYPYENVTDTLQYITPKLSAYISTGRDLKRNNWNDLTFSGRIQISPSLASSQSFGYDLNNNVWRDLVSRYSLGTKPLIFNLGSQYSLEFNRFQRVTTELAWQVNPKWSLEWLGGYDGITKQYLYNEFLVKRDLHCWDVALYYSREQKSAYLYLRLKALNFPLPQLGIGRGGQILNTSTGSPL